MVAVNLSAEIKTNSRNSSSSRMRGKVQGFVIEDSVNNIPFPVSRPILDTSKSLFYVWLKEFKSRYGNELDVMPWHYVVEMGADTDYIIHATRPISQKFPAGLDWYQSQIESNSLDLNRETSYFFDSQANKDLQSMIHVLIIGDSTIDVYTRDIYKKLGQYIIGPLSRMNMISPISNITVLNMGDKFNTKALIASSSNGA